MRRHDRRTANVGLGERLRGLWMNGALRFGHGAAVHLLAVGRHADGLRPRRRRALRRAHRRAAVPRRRQRRAAADDAAGHAATATASGCQGLRELLEQLRRERQERLDRHDLGGVYDEIARELDDIVDEERHAVDNASRAAEQSGDRARAQNAPATRRPSATCGSTCCPTDLAGKVRELRGVRLRVGRGRAALRAADGQAPRAADAADGRPDERRRCRTCRRRTCSG